MDHFKDMIFYLRIDFDPKIKIVKENSEMVLNVKRSNHLSEQLFFLISKNLLENNYLNSGFYLNYIKRNLVSDLFLTVPEQQLK